MDLEIGADHPVAGDCRFPNAEALLVCGGITVAGWALILGALRYFFGWW